MIDNECGVSFWGNENVLELDTVDGCTVDTVHVVLKERTLKWFAILFYSGPGFVRTLYHDPSTLGGATWLIVSLS